MATTIYATFQSEREAERAAGALMDHGINAADISFIIPEAVQPVHAGYQDANTPAGWDAITADNAPASDPATVYPNVAPRDIPTPNMAVPPAPGLPPIMGHAGPLGQAPTEVPPAQGYRNDQLGMVIADPIPMNPPAMFHTAPSPSIATMPPAADTDALTHVSRLPTLAGDISIDVAEANHGPHIVDNTRALPHAAHGISTTTGRDAEKGALEGAGFGLGLGLILGLAAVAIPGIGLVAGAGALVASLTAATGVAGAVAGGAYGFLNDLGVPPHYVQHLQNHLQSGGPILSIGITPAVPEAEIIFLLEKYGATSAQVF